MSEGSKAVGDGERMKSDFGRSGNTMEYDQEIGTRYISGISVSVAHERGRYTVVTNSTGQRSSREYALQKPDGVTRLLVFGDSFTAGSGVDNHERFTDQMEALRPGLELINCGLPGSGTDQQLLLLKRLVGRFEHDGVLVCPLVENIRRNIARYRLWGDDSSEVLYATPKPYFTLTGDGLRLCNVPVPPPVPLADLPESELQFVDFSGVRSYWLGRLRRAGSVLLSQWSNGTSHYQPHPEYDDPRSLAWRLMARLLREMVEVNAGRPTVIAPLPYDVQINHPPTANHMPRFQELACDSVSVVDVMPAFWALEMRDRRRCRYRRDPHYTPFAHQVVAEALLRGLANLGLVSARASDDEP